MPKAGTNYCLLVLASLLGLLLIMVLNALNVEDLQPKVLPCRASDEDFIAAPGNVSERLAAAIRFQTVSYAPGVQNRTELARYIDFLRETYPRMHSELEVETVGNYSLLFFWKGSRPDLAPYLLTSHMDVVPVEKPHEWTVPPFEGTIRDGFIWGRGAIDDKVGVMGISEAVEFLLSRRWQPARSLYVVFHHDEEVSGFEGARAVAHLLQSRGVSLEFMVDEGMPIADGLVPGVAAPVALVGVSEKGWAHVELRVRQPGGHASMPAAETAIGVLARAVARLEANPMPARLEGGPMERLFQFLARHMDPLHRFVVGNLWAFRPLLSAQLAKVPSTNAALRTTTAVTMFNAGFKENALPSEATAHVNHRIHPADSVAAVLEHDARVIADDRVQIVLHDGLEPAPVSPDDPDHGPYRALQRAVKQVFPEALVAPSLFLANSDTRHYWNLTDSIYRFVPCILQPPDLKRIHGTDERVAVDNYERVVNFYYHLIRHADLIGIDEPQSHAHEEL